MNKPRLRYEGSVMVYSLDPKTGKYRQDYYLTNHEVSKDVAEKIQAIIDLHAIGDVEQ